MIIMLKPQLYISIYNLIKRHVIIFAYIVLFIYLTYPWPYRFASHFDYIERSEMVESLVEKTTENITNLKGSKCTYSEVINDNSNLYAKPYTEEVIGPEEILPGGEYIPKDCVPRFSTAVVIVYRNREEHLHKFITYIHNFLRKQRIHYRIFLIEQFDSKPFNRAKLFNIGAVTAMKFGFPCLILHDVDLLPMTLGNIYACSRLPRHMSSSIDIFRFNLPYAELVGGVTAIDTDTFKIINGLSNCFEGWGGEDDDFYRRLRDKGYEISRFQPTYSRYTMLTHAKAEPNNKRVDILSKFQDRLGTDGLNSLAYAEKYFKLEQFYTHVLVET